MKRRGLKTAAAAGLLAAVLALPPAGMPVHAALTPEAEDAWESAKEDMRDALDELRDLGFSPMDIVQNAVGSEHGSTQEEPGAVPQENTVSETSDAGEDPAGGTPTDLQQTADKIRSELQEKTQQAGEILTEKAAEAGEELIDQAGEAAKKHAGSITDRLRERLMDRLYDWIDGLFKRQ
ncbi:MAG: hypothetical protein IJV14_18445 [Lachnospiraceae bacterium]|nr:hypothetical protein [Lachnospiraceae bacterium]